MWKILSPTQTSKKAEVLSHVYTLNNFVDHVIEKGNYLAEQSNRKLIQNFQNKI
jgi:hypothetical protein